MAVELELTVLLACCAGVPRLPLGDRWDPPFAQAAMLRALRQVAQLGAQRALHRRVGHVRHAHALLLHPHPLPAGARFLPR